MAIRGYLTPKGRSGEGALRADIAHNIRANEGRDKRGGIPPDPGVSGGIPPYSESRREVGTEGLPADLVTAYGWPHFSQNSRAARFNFSAARSTSF